MKNGCCILSIFILLFISQVSGKQCVRDDGSIKVCAACVQYSCPDLGEKKFAHGCPKDFFRECSSQKAAISLIKRKGANEMVYFDSVVSYITGCSVDYDDGNYCLGYKAKSAREDKKELEEKGLLKPGEVYWDSESGSSLKKKSSVKSATAASKVSSASEESLPDNIEETTVTTTEKNGALKFIGIFSFGWMLLFAAAWIY